MLTNNNNNNQNDDFHSEKTNNDEDSLYSSVMSSKKSGDFFSREFSNYSKLDSVGNDEDDLDLSHIKHVEQHELSLGWIKCCDENGIYYWHKPSGTVTRRPPPIMPEKNFNINEENKKLSLTCSSTSSSASSNSNQNNNNNNNNQNIVNNNSEFDFTADGDYESVDHLNIEKEDEKLIDSEPASSRSSYLSCGTKSSNEQQQHQYKQQDIKRFYVRSLGWVRIDEDDLTPERSSKAVNKCINDLSRGHRDINDVVARWGEV